MSVCPEVISHLVDGISLVPIKQARLIGLRIWELLNSRIQHFVNQRQDHHLGATDLEY